MDVMQKIKEQVDNNPVLIYMKGTPQLPQCGFSNRAAESLKQCGRKFAYVNVLMDMDIFQNLPAFSNWPTFPQIYIDGQLVGGCDIVVDLHSKGELKKMVDAAHSKQAGESAQSSG